MSRRDGGAQRVSLVIRNIPVDTRMEDLRTLFERYGDVRDIYLPRDYYTQQARGFGFVEFRDSRDAEEAMYSLDRSMYNGREISVTFSREARKTPREMMRLEDKQKGPSDRGGYERGGYERGGYERGGYDRGGYDRGGYGRDRDYDGGRGGRGRSRSRSPRRRSSRSPRRSSRSPPPRRSYSRSPRDRSPRRSASPKRGRSPPPRERSRSPANDGSPRRDD